MISDFLPVNMRDTALLPFAAPAVAMLATDRYVFNQTSTFRAEGGALYLFDSYSMCANITQEQFAHCVGFGAAGVTNNEFVPTLSFGFSGLQSGPDYFPTFRPAVFGLVPIRVFGMAPSDENFTISVSISGTVLWDLATYASPPPFMSFVYGLNVYKIKNQAFIKAYQSNMAAGNQCRC